MSKTPDTTTIEHDAMLVQSGAITVSIVEREPPARELLVELDGEGE